jgi:hypothetical protein
MTTPDFIRENFDRHDRLAIVLLNKRTHEVIQRLATAESMTSSDFQAWLQFKNREGFEVYLSMNALSETAEGRTKRDIGMIRHVFLDFDEDGTSALERLLRREDLPRPNFVTNTSPDKWQVIWKVQRFEIDQAEQLQKVLARQTGADIAATDCARVVRLPGFYNHKYAQPHWVGVEKLSDEVHGADEFPRFPEREAGFLFSGAAFKRQRSSPAVLSQSEKDWAFAKRSLARGDSPEQVASAIASYRRFDKSNPRYYAELTVQKAAASLAAERVESPER